MLAFVARAELAFGHARRMRARRRATQRKVPSQVRSRAMVESIVEATTRVLLKEGYEACTTNRVAKAAGVSIGSLYQYFPDKEALVVAVMERYQAELKEALLAPLGAGRRRPRDRGARDGLGAARGAAAQAPAP
jgi:AcrR family transcriptional regulator